jgi:hypothetical protein
MNIKYSESQVSVKTIKQGEPDFHFCHDGVTLTPRASLEISPVCPSHMRLMIERAIVDGYLRPVAHMREDEFMWEKLQT